MSKMKKIVSNWLEESVKPKAVYNSVKLSQYFKVKDPVPQKYKSDIVYKCLCLQIVCNESYTSETERRFEERIIDHNKRGKNDIFTNIVAKIVIPTFGWTIFK